MASMRNTRPPHGRRRGAVSDRRGERARHMSDERATDDGQAGERPAPAASPDPAEHLFEEKDRIEGLNRIRQLVFGSLDGLLVPPGVVSAVAGGTGSSTAVIVAGIAEAFAGALSMGAGEFISSRAEAQVQQTEVQKELEEIRL